jgi:hypothetical protein
LNFQVLKREAAVYESRHRANNSEVSTKSTLVNIAEIAGSEKFTSLSEIASCSYEARKAGESFAISLTCFFSSGISETVPRFFATGSSNAST